MKRPISLLLTAALLTSLLLAAVPAGAAFPVPEDMYEEPEMIEHEDEYVIFDAEDAKKMLNCNQKAERVELNEGYAIAVNAPGNGELIKLEAPFLLNAPLSIEDYDYDELALRLHFYVSDPTVFTANCELELTSSGKCDNLELNFSPDKHFKLKAGWNSLYLPFSEGGVKNGSLDVTKINFLRFYFFLNKGAILAFDNIKIVPCVDLDVSESTPGSSWSVSGGTAEAQSDCLRISANGTARLSSPYDLHVLKPARTQLTFRIRPEDANAICSIKLELQDAASSVASATIPTDSLTSGAFSEISIILSKLKSDAEYNFELTDTVTLIIETEGQTTFDIKDFRVKTYDTEYFYDWVPGYTTEPGAYSMAVIPDIQELSAKYPQKLMKITQWIADNKEKENILFAMDLGDVTWNGHMGPENKVALSEFAVARAAFDILQDAGIDYSISYGNHDYTPAGRNTSLFNEYFPLELFESFDSYGGTMNESKSDNTYFTFKGGNTDYLIIALEYSPDNKTISWANDVVTAHPNHKVIVTTHGYLQGDSAKTVAQENALAPAVGADRLWNNLLKKHENILMLICGHAWSQSYSGDLVMRQDKGEHGNTVYQIMANAQDIDDSRGGVGLLLMLRFSEDGNVIDFHWFSPVSGETFRPNNQFKLAIQNTLTIQGIEENAAYCGDVSFTLDSLTSVTVKAGGTVLEPIDGVYTIPALEGKTKQQRISLIDPFGDTIQSLRITIHDGHSGGQASCTAAAVCEVCGEDYGERLPHVYLEDALCSVCGAADPDAVEATGCRSTLSYGVIPLIVAATFALEKRKKKKKDKKKTKHGAHCSVSPASDRNEKPRAMPVAFRMVSGRKNYFFSLTLASLPTLSRR